MADFERFIPRGRVRQPRIMYRIDDPTSSILEELRAFGGFRRMAQLYLEALRIGAEVILDRAAKAGEWERMTPVMPAENSEPVSGRKLSPVKVLGVKTVAAVHRPRSAPSRTDSAPPAKMPSTAGPNPATSAPVADGAPWAVSPLEEMDAVVVAGASALLSVTGPPVTSGTDLAAASAAIPPAFRPSSAADAQFASFGD